MFRAGAGGVAGSGRQPFSALAAVLRRPAFMPVPAVAIRVLFGEMGGLLILKGQAVVPARLTELGFRWLEPTLDGALRWELGIPEGPGPVGTGRGRQLRPAS